MRWVMKVTRFGNQHRITLPGTFCKKHDIKDIDYMIIDDRDPEQITIRRMEYEEKDTTIDKND